MELCSSLGSNLLLDVELLMNTIERWDSEERVLVGIPGQSVLGSSSSVKMCSNVPAHTSRLVRKSDERLKIFLRVAGGRGWRMECLNSEVSGRPTMVPLLVHGETMTAEPRRRAAH